MVKNSDANLFAALLIAAIISPVFLPVAYAQTGVSFEAEIQNLERSANTQGIPAEQRHDILVRLAQLRQLSGDIEGAAKNWLEAAGAVPGSVDDDALLACAYCLAAMGEWDRASAALEPLLIKSSRARFLELSIRAVKTGDTTVLASLAANPEYAQLKSEIYFMLWKISQGESAGIWRQRLTQEFPQTIEGRIAAGGNPEALIVRPTPFWLFMGGLDSLLETAATGGNAQASPASSSSPASTPAQPATPAITSAAAPVSTSATPATAENLVRLQTGIFSRQANAQAQANNLRQAGFTPAIEERISGGNQMWAVTVPSGQDTNRTIRELQNAGFESFPIR